MYLLTNSRMFSLNVRFVEYIRYDKLAFVKLRCCSDIVSDQRRNCYRLQNTFPVMVERIAGGKKTKLMKPAQHELPLPMGGHTIDFSDGGMLIATNDHMEIGESVHLTFYLDTEETETIEAEVLRFERMGRVDTELLETTELSEPMKYEPFRYKVAVKFSHKCKKQKNRFYKYIVNQQLETLRQQANANEVHQPD